MTNRSTREAEHGGMPPSQRKEVPIVTGLHGRIRHSSLAIGRSAMMRLRYYIELYGAYFQQAMKTLAQYRTDFGIMAVSASVREGTTLLFLSAIFGRITQLQGWSFYEIVLAYGIGTVAGSFGNTFLNMPHGV